MRHFDFRGSQLAYSVFGEGAGTTLLSPGLLFSQRMQWPLARALAGRGHRVVTFDPLGHGDSDRPTEMWKYSMSGFAAELLGLMDHLELEEAVVGGTSLGANITLELAAAAPERVRGMVLEMPVLDNALLACALAFTPLMVGLSFGEKPVRAFAGLVDRLPRAPLPESARWVVDLLAQDPKPSASILQGLFFGRVAPPRELRRTFAAPALVIGHPRDPVHPFSDADELAAELPDARLVNASSFFEMRFSPERLTDEIAAFVDHCWQPRPAERGRGRTRRRRAAAG